MRINDLLSKPISEDFVQCDPFLGDKNLGIGKQKNLKSGQIYLTYHCSQCDKDITFQSIGDLFCIRADKRLLSIDSVLECVSCKIKLPIWFLVESEKDMDTTTYNKYRILKITEKFNSNITFANNNDYGDFNILLNKAEISHRNQLGAASIVYLRKIYEGITMQMVEAGGITKTRTDGRQKSFNKLLIEVNEKFNIIPVEFSSDKYKLFEELSNIIHSARLETEDDGLKKYQSLKRLITGILDNIKNKQEIMDAIGTLGWNREGENNE